MAKTNEANCIICNGPKTGIGKRPYASRIKKLRKIYGDNCGICGFKVIFDGVDGLKNISYTHPCSPSVDHILEVYKGGCSHIKNLRITHYFCNTSRPLLSDKPIEFWGRHRKKVLLILRENNKAFDRSRLKIYNVKNES